MPDSFEQLCQIVERVDGMRFRDLFQRRPKCAATGDEALWEVLAGAEQFARTDESPG